MRVLQTVAIAGCLTMIAAVLAPVVSADAWDRKTVITFSAPVEIPGVHLAGWGVLPAGTYTFKVMDSQSDRHIVQISNEDGTKVYATILAIPNFRLKATDKTVITFRERPAGEPEALRAWFYPGRNWGEEFVYPKAKAIEIAKATNTAVLFSAVELPLEVTEPVKLADTEVVMELKKAPIMAVTPAGEEVVLAQVVTPPPAEEVQAEAVETRAAIKKLPETASEVPMFALIGIIALLGALALRSPEKNLV